MHKSVGRHQTFATVLGLASELNLIVVKIRFRCGFWFNWTLAFRKKLLPECIPSTQIFCMTREAEVENVEKWLFCINQLWTENIKKFVTSENDFVPNEFTVKNFEYNPCIISLSDSVLWVNMTTFFVEKKFPWKKSNVCPFWGKNYWSKKRHTFWTLIWRSFFFGKRFEVKTRRSKKQSNDEYRPPQQQIITRDARGIYQEENSTSQTIWTATSRNGYNWSGRLRGTYAWKSSVFDWKSTKQ